MTPVLQIAAIVIATVGTGAATMGVMNKDIPDLAVPQGDWTASNVLDGQSYQIVGTDLASGEVLKDDLIFDAGTFQSVNCQKYCDFGWSEYKTKTVGDVIHFHARTVCPDAPHTVVWYGTVTGDAMQLEGTWTTRRWYWTHQIAFEATGTITPLSETGISG